MLSLTPQHELVQLCDLVVGDAAKNVGEPSLRIDAAELCRFDQGIGDAATFPPPGPRVDGEASAVTVAYPSWTSASGQNRKSSVGLGMSVPGGRAEVDFGRLDFRV